jgi:hypothetical protein
MNLSSLSSPLVRLFGELVDGANDPGGAFMQATAIERRRRNRARETSFDRLG